MFCETIVVPKTLVIKNRRLGVLRFGLQVCALGYIIFQCMTISPWNVHSEPVVAGLSTWLEEGNVSDGEVKHCTNPSAYEYTWSSDHVYRPTRCKQLSLMQSLTKISNDNLFVTTEGKSTTEWSATGENCAAAAASACAASNGTYAHTADACTCTRQEEYFVKNAERRMLNIIHSYQVKKTDPLGRATTVGGNSHTFFYNDKGKACVIGGKSEWSEQETHDGISAPLADFLSCADFDLDAPSDKTRSGEPVETHAPTSRLTGAVIHLNLIYENQAVHKRSTGNPICRIIVTVVPQWNSRTRFNTAPSPAGDYITTYSEYNFGLSITVAATGDMSFFDLSTLLSQLVDWYVLWSLASMIASMVALYCAGLLSKIYNASAREVLSIEALIPGVSSRLLSYSASFRALSHQLGVEARDQHAIGIDDLKLLLDGVFQEEKNKGVLDDKEIADIARLVMHSAGKSADSVLDMADFVSMCSRNEVLDSSTLASMLDAEWKLSILEAIFNNLHANEYGKSWREIRNHLPRTFSRGWSASMSGRLHMTPPTTPSALDQKDTGDVRVVDCTPPALLEHGETSAKPEQPSMQADAESAQGLQEMLSKELKDEMLSKPESMANDVKLVEYACRGLDILTTEVAQLKAFTRDKVTDLDSLRTEVEAMHGFVAAANKDLCKQAHETASFITRDELRSVKDSLNAKLEEVRALRATTAHDVSNTGLLQNHDADGDVKICDETRAVKGLCWEAKSSNHSARTVLDSLHEISRRRRERSATPKQARDSAV
eukprot:TRINITY_DN11897_c0_g1_i2.p1 TRINITY_DN11897_c0_g1~~TRINITY_DN11897_c0_g1_i2.p1  ORF type:complete len:774 (-),score=110.07 TRINITY_DN11897_c0_g1_i2:14-2335(-)